ncbi:hypothetical protein BJX63DRAFT_394338 [Aspergillus granulosus]|uniref:Uncharacterized protein n=1 Tax=Aspergillus granulosus TaxID=176169 RepID=A0ABR4HD33_9EURO
MRNLQIQDSSHHVPYASSPGKFLLVSQYPLRNRDENLLPSYSSKIQRIRPDQHLVPMAKLGCLCASIVPYVLSVIVKLPYHSLHQLHHEDLRH